MASKIKALINIDKKNNQYDYGFNKNKEITKLIIINAD